jgi:hypothetical protein
MEIEQKSTKREEKLRNIMVIAEQIRKSKHKSSNTYRENPLVCKMISGLAEGLIAHWVLNLERPLRELNPKIILISYSTNQDLGEDEEELSAEEVEIRRYFNSSVRFLRNHLPLKINAPVVLLRGFCNDIRNLSSLK